MSTIENGYIQLYCHFNEIIKGSGTSFKSPALKENMLQMFCHTAQYYLTKFHFDSTEDSKEVNISVAFNYIAMSIVTSQILKSVDFTRTQKPRYLQNEASYFLQIKKLITH